MMFHITSSSYHHYAYYACTMSTMPVLCLLCLYYVYYACTMSTIPVLCLLFYTMPTIPVLCLLCLYYAYYSCTMPTIPVLCLFITTEIQVHVNIFMDFSTLVFFLYSLLLANKNEDVIVSGEATEQNSIKALQPRSTHCRLCVSSMSNGVVLKIQRKAFLTSFSKDTTGQRPKLPLNLKPNDFTSTTLCYHLVCHLIFCWLGACFFILNMLRVST